MDATIPIIAGSVSTTIFAVSAMPMLWKAARTRDLSSYSLGNIVLSNVGNVVHSVYVFHLPAGPVWALHSFYLVTTALMLMWYLRYSAARRSHVDRTPRDSHRRGGPGRLVHRLSPGPAQATVRHPRRAQAGRRQLARTVEVHAPL
jgi:hypothetical protein